MRPLAHRTSGRGRSATERMNESLIKQILECQQLPSLPAIAVRVIELTSDENASFDELASLIQNDQGIASKVLRTVNSSYYGLRQPCSTIHKAIVLLGLSPVKSLALGFSLVEALGNEDAGFPYQSYWRRGLFAAVGGKAIATRIGSAHAEEAFLAGLLQDIGMVALYRAMGQRYTDLIRVAGGDHARLSRMEVELFDIDHATVGTMLGDRWKLPRELLLPIRYHERPSAAPVDCLELVRCLALANIACDALNADEPAAPMRRFHTKASEWFRLGDTDCDELFSEIVAGTREVSSLFRLNTGSYPDPHDILVRAEQQLIANFRSQPRESVGSEAFAELTETIDDRDPVTGLLGRHGFEVIFEGLCARAAAAESPLTVVQVAIDGLGPIGRAHGPTAADEVAIAVAAILHNHFEPLGAITARLSGSIFAALLPDMTAGDTARTSTAFLAQVRDSRERWLREITKEAPVAIPRISIGVAGVDTAAERARLSAMARVTNAVRAARSESDDAIRTVEPRAEAA